MQAMQLVRICESLSEESGMDCEHDTYQNHICIPLGTTIVILHALSSQVRLCPAMLIYPSSYSVTLYNKLFERIFMIALI